MNTNKKDMIICLDEVSPNDTTIMSAITLDINDKNTPCYLPLINNNKNNTSELILVAIDKPHI